MENILVLPSALLVPYLKKDGLTCGCERELYALVEKEHLFLPRPAAEEDPAYRQVICYITLVRGDEVYCTRRLAKGTEKRLQGLLSLGLGGHINDSDDRGVPGEIFRRGLERELHEEAEFTPAGELIPLGVIKEDGSEVGLVHMGFSFKLEVTEASIRETEKLEGFWMKKSELSSYREQFETWSQFVMDVL